MYNCASDVLAYHDDKVTLPQVERTNMSGRRDANRERLKKGLKDKGKPAPREFASQGSYAMKTMTQHPAKDYDIDDGVYFDKAVLFGGANRTPSLPSLHGHFNPYGKYRFDLDEDLHGATLRPLRSAGSGAIRQLDDVGQGSG